MPILVILTWSQLFWPGWTCRDASAYI